MDIKKEIAACYANVVGQSKIVANRILDHVGFAMGDNSPYPVLYTGEAGLGKTHLLRAEAKARAVAIDYRFKRAGKVSSFKSPQEFRKAGDAFFSLIRSFQDGDGVIVDELHEMNDNPTVQMAKLTVLLKRLMDRDSGELVSAQVDDKTFISREKHMIFVASGTNFPKSIPDGAAIISRFGGETVLEPYTTEELVKILSILATDAKVNIHESTLALLARCARGAARPLKKIVGHLAKVAIIEGKRSVNRAEALEAIRHLSLYPCGLSKREVAMLLLGKGNGFDMQSIHLRFRIERRAAKDDISFLVAERFLSPNKGNCILTSFGATYLENLKADKFELPNV